MVQCVDGETKVWDDLLNADYQRLLGVLPSTAVESVRQAQRSWIVTRDADCHVPYDIFEGGTMARLDFGKLRARPHGAARAAVARLARNGAAELGLK